MSRDMLFIPGQGCSAEDYPRTLAGLENAGLRVDVVTPPWDELDFDEAIKQTGGELSRRIGSTSLTVVAHSHGVNLALPELARQPGIRIVLSSPSIACVEGYNFEEGREVVERVFPRHVEEIKRFSLAAIARTISIPPKRVAVLQGSLEIMKYPSIKQIGETLARSLGVRLTIIPEAPHFIDESEQYVQAIVDAALRVSEA